MNTSKSNTILRATLLVGVLDALAAIVVYGIFFNYTPIQIYQFVSSAVLGNAAYSGGIPVVALGLVFHFFIALVFSYLFIQFYPHISILRSNKFLVGLVYGLVIWAVMNLLILPFTRIPPSGFGIVGIISIFWHLFLVGLPISLLAYSFYNKKGASTARH